MAKKKFEKFMTPVGTAVYPRLTQADTKFDSKGVYHTKLAIPSDEAQELIAQLEAARDKFAAEVRKETPKTKKYSLADVYEEETDDEGNETGRLIFKFKKPAAFEKDDKLVKINPPALFDAANQPLTKVDVWSGSELRIAGHIRPYAMDSSKSIGVSLRIDGAQVISLVSAGERTAESLGFDAVDGGYTAPTIDNVETAGETDDGEDEDEF